MTKYKIGQRIKIYGFVRSITGEIKKYFESKTPYSEGEVTIVAIDEYGDMRIEFDGENGFCDNLIYFKTQPKEIAKDLKYLDKEVSGKNRNGDTIIGHCEGVTSDCYIVNCNGTKYQLDKVKLTRK